MDVCPFWKDRRWDAKDHRALLMKMDINPEQWHQDFVHELEESGRHKTLPQMIPETAPIEQVR